MTRRRKTRSNPRAVARPHRRAGTQLVGSARIPTQLIRRRETKSVAKSLFRKPLAPEFRGEGLPEQTLIIEPCFVQG